LIYLFFAARDDAFFLATAPFAALRDAAALFAAPDAAFFRATAFWDATPADTLRFDCFDAPPMTTPNVRIK